jgi:hypothetical protein
VWMVGSRIYLFQIDQDHGFGQGLINLVCAPDQDSRRILFARAPATCSSARYCVMMPSQSAVSAADVKASSGGKDVADRNGIATAKNSRPFAPCIGIKRTPDGSG